MAPHAHFVGSGVQPLVDAVKANGGDPGDLRSAVWQATWARGYEDVVAPAPAARLKEEGFIVYTRAIDSRQYAAVVDTANSLWALVARGILPPLGSRVRLVPAIVEGGMGWDITILETLALGLTVRFGAKAGETNDWIDALRFSLGRINEFEYERRGAIVAERRLIIAVPPVKPFRAELDALHEEMRKRVDAETAATSEERTAYDKGNEKQRKCIIDDCKKRRLVRYNEELALLRARVPELQADHEKRSAELARTRVAITELEDAASRSRGVTERITVVENQLAAIKAAGLLVTADVGALEALGTSDFSEISRSVELLFDLIPRRNLKR